MNMPIETFVTWLEAIYYITAIIGIPVGIVFFVLQKRRERMAEELETYYKTYDRYLVFLQETLARPELLCGEFTGCEQELKDAGFNAEQITVYEILNMIMEQTFIVHSYAKMTKNHPMWIGWTNYFEWWASREDYRKAWRVIDGWYYPPFKEYMSKLVSEAERTQK